MGNPGEENGTESEKCTRTRLYVVPIGYE